MDIDYDIALPFDYSSKIVIVLLIVSIIIGLIIVFILLFGKKIIKQIKKPNIAKLKKKSINKLINLRGKVENNKIDIKSAYVELSYIVRYFIEKSTGIKATSFSKIDFKKYNLKELINLMDEYYSPEFSKNDIGNILSSIDKSVEVIKKWKRN